MKEMADAIVQVRAAGAGGACRCSSRSAPRPRHLSELTEQISPLEGQADELHDHGLRELYLANAEGGNGLAFFVGNEVYDHLEKVVDRFDDVANVHARHRHRARLSQGAGTRWTSVARIAAADRADLVALMFDFLNGLHDAANSIATIVSTRVLRPQYAVAWAAFFNFIAFLFFGLHVAETIGTRHRRRRRGRSARDLRRADGRDRAGT